MTDSWLILSKRYGGDLPSPTATDLSDAVRELFQESILGMTLEDYEEHGSAHLRLGWDEGPMYVLEISRNGTATFEQWADQDYELELYPKQSIQVTEERASELWSFLASSKLDQLRNEFKSGA